MIWKQPIDLAAINNSLGNDMVSLLGIKFTAFDDDSLSAVMPVDERTRQPYGILHGGASLVLAETIGSYASSLIIDKEKFITVGQEISASHLRPVKSGFVTGTCKPMHLGRKTHVWDIRITNEEKKLVCICRLTTAIIPI
jgi:1,4-dihydroxy-2-naphthoyl-CoA hydrolase